MLTIVIALVFALARINQADDAVSFQCHDVQLGSVRSEAISIMDRHSDRIKYSTRQNIVCKTLVWSNPVTRVTDMGGGRVDLIL